MKTLLISLLLVQSSFAATYLISDIDDTLKRTHVLGTMLRGLKTKNSFIGLSELLRMYVCNTSGDQKKFCYENDGVFHKEDRLISYVSAAPGKLATFGREFIANSHFPTGLVITRDSIGQNTVEFKSNTLTNLISNVPASLFVLLGDNGEKDPLVYSNVKKSLPNKEVKQFIHQIYATQGEYDEMGAPLQSAQVGYLTAVDLGVEFLKLKLISETDLISVTKIVYSHLVDQDRAELVIPDWARCHEFSRNYVRPEVEIGAELRVYLEKVEHLVAKRCELLSKED